MTASIPPPDGNELATGRLLWRLPAKLCGETLQEPQGLFVSDFGVLSGNPMIYVSLLIASPLATASCGST